MHHQPPYIIRDDENPTFKFSFVMNFAPAKDTLLDFRVYSANSENGEQVETNGEKKRY